MTVMKQKPSIQNTILLLLMIIAVFSTGIYSFMWVYQEYSQFKKESAVVKEEFLNSNKARVKNEVERAVKYVEYKQSQAETRLKESIKSRVYEAFNIATNIYNQNHGLKNDDEIKKMIKDSLRPIIFNNGRGYFFATNFDGISELFVDHPELEGTDLINVKDSGGRFVVRDQIEIAKDSDEGFYRYTWTKPNVEGKSFPKIAFIKHFAPYDWFIGTGEYLDDVENDIKQEIIQRLRTIRFGNNDILFAGTWEGFSVFGARKKPYRRKSLYNITDINGKKFIQELISNAKKGGGFTSYISGKEYSQRQKVKISYSDAIDDWQWYIGAGFFATDIDALIESKRTELKENIKNFILKALLVFVALLLFILLMIKSVFNRIRTNFESFLHFFSEASAKFSEIDVPSQHYKEFQQLANAANQMSLGRKQAEEALAKSEKRFREMFEQSPFGIALIGSLTGHIYALNPRFAEIAGRTIEEMKGGDWMSITHPDDVQEDLDNMALLNAGKINGFNMEKRYIRPDGSHVWINMTIAPVAVEDKTHPRHLCMIDDITARKEAQEERNQLQNKLQRSQKMEAMGLMAGGVAHDLNNILSGIVSYPELLLMDLPEESPLRNPIKTIQESGMRAADVVEDLLTIARGVASSKEVLNLNAVVEEYLDSAEQQKLEKVHPMSTFETELDSQLLNITGSASHIKKILMNLVVNASEAIEGSGTVMISTVNQYLDEPLKGYEDVRIGEYILLRVSDDGSGISPGDLERIFEPFYTKKVMGRSGTGLGLAVVWNSMQDHDGYINVKSSEKGTAFELYFPVTREEVAAEREEVPLEDYLGHGEKILVVDDEERQREIAGVILKRLGYNAETVSSGEKAIEYVKEHPVDLIVLDMVMPKGINGRKTYEEIIKIRPGQKAIIASGYAKTKEVDRAQELGAGKYIKKPYTLEKVGFAVKEELEA